MNDATQRWRVPGSGTAVSHLNRNDRFSAILVVIVTVTAISLGLVIRQRNVSQVWQYVSREAGIEAAYPAGWLSDEEGAYLGDVVISMDRARAQAPRYRHDVEAELARLLVHGVLHLLGYDHHAPRDGRAMKAAERRALAAFLPGSLVRDPGGGPV